MELTLSGAIPGLLRRGSPVRVALGPDASVSGVIVLPGRIAFRDGGADGTLEYGDRTDSLTDTLLDVFTEAVALDLTDATGRAHAAWWLQAHTQPDTGGLWLDGVTPPEDFRRAWWAVAGRLPIFAGLDPDDPRLLPDRSRWVDAEALRRVVLHVAGVTP